ncbi:unnamed protein product [Lactuca saligna]|uniref:LysM domain-containing protein n=1 Tax=Lactuca saligna TaxID=75948 RepID=A0AA35ZJ97_LACSI|nr:unnamed protein product [Lactuca saligna]
MAQINNKTIVCMLFMIFLFVGIMTTIEGRTVSLDFTIPVPFCSSVISVKNGDTCFGIAQKFKMSSEFFDIINPNLNCNKLFIGEWICVDGL